MEKIRVENLTKIFGKHPKKVLHHLKDGMNREEISKLTNHTVGVGDVSFSVNQGETFVIMGLSGSGKSTLIRCINLLNKPTDGKIFVDDKNILKFDKKELREYRQNKVAMVFQHFGLFSHRNVLENVEFGLEIKGVNKIIKPEGFIIPEEAASVHGISTERALKEGVLLNPVLKEFKKGVDEAKIIVAHNISFDEMIMGAELLRKKHEHKLFDRPKICTMQSSTDYCKIENEFGYKWPKLIELHHKLFDEGFDGAHDALADVKACARCFFELKKRGVI